MEKKSEKLMTPIHYNKVNYILAFWLKRESVLIFKKKNLIKRVKQNWKKKLNIVKANVLQYLITRSSNLSWILKQTLLVIEI